MKAVAQLSHLKLDHTKENSPHLVISLTAPTIDWVNKRPPLCIIAAVDLSGSMRGPKIEYAKKSLQKMVDHLQPGDVTGIIGFSSRAKVLVAPKEITPDFKDQLRKVIGELKADGNTDLCGGAIESFAAINSLDLPVRYLKRVILFTDGEPTTGVIDPEQILHMVEYSRGSATLSAFGYGNTSGVGAFQGCDPAFMEKLSQSGQGNYAFISDPDNALSAFGRELGGLLSTYAQDIRVIIEPVSGHSIKTVVTDIPMEKDNTGEVTFNLSSIISEETRNIVLETTVAKQDKTGPRAVNMFLVKVLYDVLTERGTKETKIFETKVKAQFVSPSEAQIEPDKALDEIIANAQVFKAQLVAEEQAKVGNYAGAQGILRDLGQKLDSRGHGARSKMVQNLQSKMADNATYAASTGYLRTMSVGGRRSAGVTFASSDAMDDLSLFGSVDNDAMRTVEASFLAIEPKKT